MADQFGAVSPDTQERTKRLLEAVASGGSAGLKAFENAESMLRTNQSQAIDAAAGLANLIGGPESQGFVPQAGANYTRGFSNLGQSRANFEALMAAQGSAHKNYLDQVAAAVPLARADAEGKLALKRAALEAAATQSSSTADPTFGDLSDSELKVRLGGAAENLYPGSSFTNDEKARSLGAFLTQSGSAAPARVTGLFPRSTKPVADIKNIQTWAKTDEKTAKTIQADPSYQSARDWAWQQLNAGVDFETVRDTFAGNFTTGGANKTRTYTALVNEFDRVFRQAGL
ncbi:MAG: hypothetical protein ACRDH5_00075 [bacterium]